MWTRSSPVLAILRLGCIAIFASPALAQLVSPVVVPPGGHLGSINTVRFCPDSAWPLLASGGNDGTVRVWDLGSRRLLRVVRASTQAIMCLDFNVQNGMPLVAAASRDGAVAVWNVEDGRKVWNPDFLFPEGASSVRFSPDGGILAAAGRDGRVALWRWPQAMRKRGSPAAIARVQASNFATDMAWNPRAPLRLATVSNHCGVDVWKVEFSGKSLTVQRTGGWMPSQEEADCAAWNPEGTSLAIGTNWDHVRLYPSRRNIEVGKAVQAVAWKGSGRLITGDTDGRLRLWNAVTRQPLSQVEIGAGWIEDAAISADGSLCACVGGLPILKLWETKTWRPLLLVRGPTSGGLTAVAYGDTSDGGALVVGRDMRLPVDWPIVQKQPDGETRIREWSLPAAGKPRTGFVPFLTAVVVSPGLCASGFSDGRIGIWTGVPGVEAPIRVILAEHAGVQALALAPKQKLVASIGSGDGPRVYSTATGALTKLLVLTATPEAAEPFDKTPSPRCLCFNAAGTLLACGDENGRITIWETTHWRRRVTWSAHSGAVIALQFNPNGTLLASGGNDGKIAAWHISSLAYGRQASNWNPAAESVMSLAWSPDGQQVVCGDMRGAVRFYKLGLSQPVGNKAHAHGAAVTAITFAEAGQLLITAADDGSILLWNARSREPQISLRVDATNEWIATTPRGFYSSSRRGALYMTFRFGARAYPFEAFDLQFNRPDLVLKNLAEMFAPGSELRERTLNRSAFYLAAYMRRCEREKVAADPTGGSARLEALPEVNGIALVH